MVVRMLAGLAVALLLDARLRRRRAWARSAAKPPIGGDAVPPPLLAPREERDLSDDELVARVLATADVPTGVEVTAVDGAVVLFGRVPRFAFAPLLSRVARVPGVADVEDRLTPVDDLGTNERA
jgi:hypothetical protein